VVNSFLLHVKYTISYRIVSYQVSSKSDNALQKSGIIDRHSNQHLYAALLRYTWSVVKNQ